MKLKLALIKFRTLLKVIRCHITERLTVDILMYSFDISGINIPSNLDLTDTKFYKSGPIDIILNADVLGCVRFQSYKNRGS